MAAEGSQTPSSPFITSALVQSLTENTLSAAPSLLLPSHLLSISAISPDLILSVGLPPYEELSSSSCFARNKPFHHRLTSWGHATEKASGGSVGLEVGGCSFPPFIQSFS